MDLDDAIVLTLTDAGEPLHWTVIQDRLLRAGHLDPFVAGGPRRAVLRTLADLADRGAIVNGPGKGVYAAADAQGR
jgi:hypothetical protein